MKRPPFRSVLCLFLMLLFLPLTACQKQPSPQDTAQALLERLLTAPDPQFQEAIEGFGADGNADDSQVLEAVSALLGDAAADELAPILIRDGVGIQLESVLLGFTSQPISVEVVESNQEHLYNYTAVITAVVPGQEDQELTITGQVRFNEEGNIDRIAFSGSDLTKFYRSIP